MDTPGEYAETVKHEFVNGRLELRRAPEEREPLLRRLRKVEGQVRGLQQMIAEDRYCLDEVQQISAITAALREVSLLIMRQHVEAGVGLALENGDRAAVGEDLLRVLRAALRQN